MSLQDKTEITVLRKSNEEHLNKIKSLSKEIDAIKQENFSNESLITDLKDQVKNNAGAFQKAAFGFEAIWNFKSKVTATLGSVQMIEQLTEQNLDLEAKISSLEAQLLVSGCSRFWLLIG